MSAVARLLCRFTACVAVCSCLAAPHSAQAQTIPYFSLSSSLIEQPLDPDSALTRYRRFGTAVAVGDFNDDGFDDVAVGDPEADVGFNQRTGLVDVFYGSAAGLMSPRGLQLSSELDLPAPCRFVADDDGFGTALAAGDFDADGFEDLAVGIPFREVPFGEEIRTDAGAVQIFWGSFDSLDGDPVLEIGPCLVRGGPIVGGEPGDFDEFGAALETGGYSNIEPADDLAIGAPGTTVDGLSEAGSVVVLYGDDQGSFAGLTPDEIDLGWYTDLPESPAAGDRFGSALASGDLVGFTAQPCDLVIGIPGRDVIAVDLGAAIGTIGCGNSGMSPLRGRFVSIRELPPGTVFGASYRAGSAVEIGNFNCTGASDIVLGVPQSDETGEMNNGAVWIFYDSGSGTENRAVEPGDLPFEALMDRGLFGSSLLTLNRGLQCDDLAVGVPGEPFQDSSIVILEGSGAGLRTTGGEHLRNGVPGAPHPLAYHGDGAALAEGRLDGDRRWLVAGRPRHEAPAENIIGAVWLLPEVGCELFCDGFEAGDLRAWQDFSKGASETGEEGIR